MRIYRTVSMLIVAAVTAIMCPGVPAQPATADTSARSVVSLNGEWQIAPGEVDSPPAVFQSIIPVPGLIDMATPPVPQWDVHTSAPRAYWYKRTFNIDEPVPAVATLKLYKAMYGSQVILNGHKFDEKWASFTPLYFDVKPILRQGENEILVRVGSHPRLMPPGTTTSLDPERIKYLAGIFDNVELILTGTPTITNIQTVPDINTSTVLVQTLLTNDTGAAREARVRYVVREHKSGREVGNGDGTVQLPASANETTVTASIKVADCQLWSPENPFLYDLVVDCGTDQVTERFGMRTFRLDQATGNAFLNGKPYYLRGSNITLYRFFEDDARGALPWDDEWVRGLHKMVRGMHWNSLRYCIGFPPEFWYDIADEEGILICDEFPIWNARHGEIPNDNDPGRLIGEFKDWMRDRWNHPCVVLWDAQNETHSTTTTIAIKAVRDMDLSNRPWDNGYSRYRPAGDSFESHAYLFNKRTHKGPFMLEDLEWHSGTPIGNAGGANENDNPIIINEYGWVWINRDGTPSRLGRPVYARLFKGRKATAAEYRHLNARLIAALTEFWRSHRACAGILHFCILGYSRPDGHTSDHFIDVKNLKLEPEFAKHVRDSFAPVGVMINFFTPQVNPNERRELGVAIVNDLYEDWSGKVRLELLRDGKVVEEHVQTCTVPGLGRNELAFPFTFPTAQGDYQLKATIAGAGNEEVSSWRDVKVAPVVASDVPTPPGIAVGKPAKASSITSRGDFPPEFAFDGNPETRWASEYETPQWLTVDLEKLTDIHAVELVWENAYAKSYSIEVSVDGESWTKVHETDQGYGEEPIIKFNPVPAQYVRLTVTENGTKWGASLWEMKVF